MLWEDYTYPCGHSWIVLVNQIFSASGTFNLVCDLGQVFLGPCLSIARNFSQQQALQVDREGEELGTCLPGGIF